MYVLPQSFLYSLARRNKFTSHGQPSKWLPPVREQQNHQCNLHRWPEHRHQWVVPHHVQPGNVVQHGNADRSLNTIFGRIKRSKHRFWKSGSEHEVADSEKQNKGWYDHADHGERQTEKYDFFFLNVVYFCRRIKLFATLLRIARLNWSILLSFLQMPDTRLRIQSVVPLHPSSRDCLNLQH